MEHPLSSIHATASIGAGTTIGAFTVIGENVVIGEGGAIGNGVVIHAGSRLGAGVRVDDHAVIGKQPLRGPRSAITRATSSGRSRAARAMRPASSSPRRKAFRRSEGNTSARPSEWAANGGSCQPG